ncbi:MAG: FGGY family carbohydrate kinase [Rikenellaceae bacterium]
MKSLGIDIGSSSIKVSLMDISSGECAGSVSLPDSEMTIDALKSGWAEQFPLMWWDYVCSAITLLGQHFDLKEVASIGITYQMHGLVCVGSDGVPLRKAIIWCDSRATEIGAEALEQLGRESCLSRTLNSPGNFTASKFAWVMRNEPDIFAKTTSFMLPGDFIAYKLSGKINTTLSGLSEQILWNFKEDKRADFVAENYGIPLALIPNELPSIGIQAYTDQSTATLLGIKKGTPISYRAGDQPNNAFSLNVMENGEVAATGGTSGVVYGVTNLPKADPLSRVNTFLHVNHSSEAPRYGVLLCINGTGILNAWVRRNIASDMSYDEINNLCEMVEVGCDGVSMLPFGNGAERMLENRFTGASLIGVDLNRHGKAHILRASQEGIAYAFRYGIDIMREVGVEPKVIRAGKANLFLSPLFRRTLATLCDARIELYNTDGALGAARGAALGAGLYKNREEAFASLRKLETIEPDNAMKAALEHGYQIWKRELNNKLMLF